MRLSLTKYLVIRSDRWFISNVILHRQRNQLRGLLRDNGIIAFEVMFSLALRNQGNGLNKRYLNRTDREMIRFAHPRMLELPHEYRSIVFTRELSSRSDYREPGSIRPK